MSTTPSCVIREIRLGRSSPATTYSSTTRSEPSRTSRGASGGASPIASCPSVPVKMSSASPGSVGVAVLVAIGDAVDPILALPAQERQEDRARAIVTAERRLGCERAVRTNRRYCTEAWGPSPAAQRPDRAVGPVPIGRRVHDLEQRPGCPGDLRVRDRDLRARPQPVVRRRHGRDARRRAGVVEEAGRHHLAGGHDLLSRAVGLDGNEEMRPSQSLRFGVAYVAAS